MVKKVIKFKRQNATQEEGQFGVQRNVEKEEVQKILIRASFCFCLFKLPLSIIFRLLKASLEGLVEVTCLCPLLRRCLFVVSFTKSVKPLLYGAIAVVRLTVTTIEGFSASVHSSSSLVYLLLRLLIH